MRKIFLILLFLVIAAPCSRAELLIEGKAESVETITGTIERLGKNSIDIEDESDHKVKRLAYIPGRREFRVGQRVRAQYDITSRVVQTIKHMTPVEIKPGQNGGYLLKK